MNVKYFNPEIGKHWMFNLLYIKNPVWANYTYGFYGYSTDYNLRDQIMDLFETSVKETMDFYIELKQNAIDNGIE